MSCGPVVPVGQLLTPVHRLHLGEVFRLPACLGSVAVAAQIEADGFADAGAASLAQLECQLIQLALQLWFHPHTGHHGGGDRWHQARAKLDLDRAWWECRSPNGGKGGMLMAETMEGGPQQAPAGVASGGAGCGTTTEGSLAISSGGRIQIYPLRMTISSVPLWIIIPQAATDGLSLRSRGHGRLRHRRVTGLAHIALRRATRVKGSPLAGCRDFARLVRAIAMPRQSSP